jgi:type IV secretory pathway TraG/TraD family ATPase VirD4
MYGLVVLVIPTMFFYGTMELCAYIGAYYAYPYEEFWVRITANGYAQMLDYFNPSFISEWIGDYWDTWILSSMGVSTVIAFVTAVVISTRMDKNKKETSTTILDNKNTIKSLLAKGKPKSEGVFAGKYTKDFYVSYEDRGLVVGPPATGKTAFLINQILKVADSKISFIAADIKPEIHSIVEEALIEKGYEVPVINPLSDVGIRYNPLSDIKEEIQINELVLNLLPLPLRGEPVWIQAQQWYLRLGLLYLHHNPNRICSL